MRRYPSLCTRLALGASSVVLCLAPAHPLSAQTPPELIAYPSAAGTTLSLVTHPIGAAARERREVVTHR